MDELDATKNKLQKVEIEKNYFAKKIELAEREQKFNSNYQSRILKQETCLRSLEHEVNRWVNPILSFPKFNIASLQYI